MAKFSFKKWMAVLLALAVALTLCSALVLMGGSSRGRSDSVEQAQASTNGGLDQSLYPLPLYVYEPMSGLLEGKSGLLEVNFSNWGSNPVYSDVHSITVYSGEKSKSVFGMDWKDERFERANMRSPYDGSQISSSFSTLPSLPSHTGRFYTMAPVEYDKIFTVVYSWRSTLHYVIRFTYVHNGLGYVCNFKDTDRVAALPEKYIPNASWFDQVTMSGDTLTVNDVLTPDRQQHLTADITDNKDGSYTVAINPKGNYTWDGGVSDESLKAKIFKITTKAPTVKKPAQDDGYTVEPNATYTGEEIQGVTLGGGFDPNDYVIETSGPEGTSATTVTGAKATKAGKYKTTIQPAAGKTWEGTEGNSDPIEIEWEIQKAEQKITVDKSASIASGKDTAELTLNVTDDKLYNQVGKVTVQTQPEGCVDVTVTGKNITVKRKEGSAGASGGTVNVTVTVEGNENLNPKELAFTVDVAANPGFYLDGKAETTYQTLAEAVEALKAVSGEKPAIVVRGDVTVSEPITADGTAAIVLKGEAGSKLTVDIPKAALFELGTGAAVTLGENLTVTGTESAKLAHLTAGSLTVNGATVQDFIDTAITVEGGTLTITNGTFTGNKSNTKGGVVSATAGEIQITDGIFRNNFANQNGGAVALEGSAHATIAGGTFEGNQANTNGGAVSVAGKAKAEITNGTFTTNDAKENGGALYLDEEGQAIVGVEKVTFMGNVATVKGGAVAVAKNNTGLTLNNVVIANNKASGFANGINLENGAKATVASATLGAEGISDGIGLSGQSTIELSGKLQSTMTVEFEHPDEQFAAAADTGHEFITSKDGVDTAKELKAQCRVKNPGYTFSPDSSDGNDSLTLVKSTDIVARVKIGNEYREFYTLQAAIDEAAAESQRTGSTAEVQLVAHENEFYKDAEGNLAPIYPEPIELTDKITIPKNADISFGSILRKAVEEGRDFQYEKPATPVILKRAQGLTEEMIEVERGGKLTLGDITLDGGANWDANKQPKNGTWDAKFASSTVKIKDDGKSGAGSVETNNTGITAHAPVIVNGGELTIGNGATIQNNDNNYAAPGENFGSQYYGGGVRNEGAGKLTMTGGTIKDCYSREGGAIMNVNKAYDNKGGKNEAYVAPVGGVGPQVLLTGGSVTGNVSQQKGAAVQSIYGGAATKADGTTIDGNISLNDLGVLSVEEGASLTVSGGTVSAITGNKALYLYNQYSDDDYNSADTKPYIENHEAGKLHVTGAPVINGFIHLDDPCTVHTTAVGGSGKKYESYLDVSGYTGGALTLSFEKGNLTGGLVRPSGKIAVGDDVGLGKLPAHTDSTNGLSGSYYTTVAEEGGKKALRYGNYLLEVSQTEPGKLNVTGSVDPAVTEVTFTVGGKEMILPAVNGVVEGTLSLPDKTDYEAKLSFGYGEGETVNIGEQIALGVVQFDPDLLELSLPNGARYAAEDGDKSLTGKLLPNDIVIDENGDITVKLDNGTEQHIHIGVRAAAATQKEGDVTWDSVAFNEGDTCTLTFAAENGMEYHLLKDGAFYEGEGLTGWVMAEDGKVTFRNLPLDGEYTLVARNAEDGKLAGAYAAQGALKTPTSAMMKAYADFQAAYEAVENGLWSRGEDGSINAPQTLAAAEKLQAVAEKFTALEEASTSLAAQVREDYERAAFSLPYAQAAEWKASNKEVFGKLEGDTGLDYQDDSANVKSAIDGYKNLSQDAQNCAVEDYIKLLNGYATCATKEIRDKMEIWFEENGISEENKAQYQENVGEAYKARIFAILEEETDDIVTAIDGIVTDKLDSTLALCKEYLEAQKSFDEMSDARKIAVTETYTEAFDEIVDKNTATERLTEIVSTATAAFGKEVLLGKAEKQYLDSYFSIKGKEADPDEEAISALFTEWEALPEVNAAALNGKLAEGIKALITAAYPTASSGSTAADQYVKAASEAVENLKGTGDAIANFAESLTNLKAVSEYLNAYREIEGKEADTNGDQNVKDAIDAIKKAAPQTVDDGQGNVSTEPLIEAVNRVLAEKVNEIIESSQFADEMKTVAKDAVQLAAEEANSPEDGAQYIAEIAEALALFHEKASTRQEYIDSIKEIAEGGPDTEQLNAFMQEVSKCTTVEAMNDALKQAVKDAITEAVAKDSQGVKEVAKTYQDKIGLLASEGIVDTSNELRGFKAAIEGKRAEDRETAIADYSEAYKNITGKTAPATDATIEALKAAANCTELNEILQEAVNSLLDSVLDAFPDASEEAKAIIVTAKGEVEDAVAEANDVADLSEVVKNVKPLFDGQRLADSKTAAEEDYREYVLELTEKPAENGLDLESITLENNGNNIDEALTAVDEALKDAVNKVLAGLLATDETGVLDSENIQVYIDEVKASVIAASAASGSYHGLAYLASALASVKDTLANMHTAETEAAKKAYGEAYEAATGNSADAVPESVAGTNVVALNEALRSAVGALLSSFVSPNDSANAQKIVEEYKSAVNAAVAAANTAKSGVTLAEAVQGAKAAVDAQKASDMKSVADAYKASYSAINGTETDDVPVSIRNAANVSAANDAMKQAVKQLLSAALTDSDTQTARQAVETARNGIDAEEAGENGVSDLADIVNRAMAILSGERTKTAVEDAKKEYKESYQEIVGKECDENASDGKAALGALEALKGTEATPEEVAELLKEKVNALLEGVKATSQGAKSYIAELQEKVEAAEGTEEQAIPDLSEIVKHAQVVCQYLDSYNNINGTDASEQERKAFEAKLTSDAVAELNGKLKEEVNGLLGGMLSEEENVAGNPVKAIVEEAQAAVDAAVAQATDHIADVADVTKTVKAAVEEEREKIDYAAGGKAAGDAYLGENSVVTKDFSDVGASDKDALEKAKEKYEKLEDKVKKYLDREYAGNADGFMGELQDRLNKAEFEQLKEGAIERTEALVRGCDGENVRKVNEKQVENLKQENYEQQPDKTAKERERYFEDLKEALKTKEEQAKERTQHAQHVQRAENLAREKAEELKESGNYNDGQKQQIEDVVKKFLDDLAANGDTLTEEQIDEKYEKAIDDMLDVPAHKVTVGDMFAKEYPEDVKDEIWGSVEATEKGLTGGADLHFEKQTELPADLTDLFEKAVKQGNFTAAGGFVATEDELERLVGGKHMKFVYDVYLTKDGTRVEQSEDGSYIVRFLMADLGELGNLLVVQVSDDGISVCETIVDGNWVEFKTSSLGDFQILAENVVDLTWLIILLSCILAAVLIATILIAVTNRNGGKGDNAEEHTDGSKQKTMATALPLPLLLTVYIPNGAVIVCVVLGALIAVALGALTVAILKSIKRKKKDK